MSFFIGPSFPSNSCWSRFGTLKVFSAFDQDPPLHHPTSFYLVDYR